MNPQNYTPYQPSPRTRWEVTDPVAFSFKRIFSRTWHVWIGVTALFMVGMTALTAAVIAPVAIRTAGQENPQLGAGSIASLVVFYVLMIAASIYFSALLYNAALRETRGEEQTWGTVFRGVPIGRMLLAFVVVLLAMLVIYALLAAVMFLAFQVVEWLVAVVAVIALVASIPVVLVLTFVQMYILDGYSVGDAFSRARRDVMGNFWKVLGAHILLSIAGYAVALVTLGLGLVVYVPLVTLGTVYIYRMISGASGDSSVSAA